MPACRFADVIKELSGHEAVPVRPDHPILNILESGLRSLTGTACTGARVNEVGTCFEAKIRDAVKDKADVEAMPRSGYPDMRASVPGHQDVYVEVKVTAKDPGERSRFRAFYLSKGDKITGRAGHVLVRLFLKPRAAGTQMFMLKGWEIKDLCLLPLRLKKEYNATPDDMGRLGTLRRS